jgi:pyruvate/2-oxoglutarate dehydrogenase complex dihydrolipoamide acyltransferase (E2) component
VEVLGGGEEEEEKAAAFMSSSEEEKEDGNGEEKGEEGGGGLLRRLKDFFWQPPAEPTKKQSPPPAAAAPAGPATATAKKETIHVYSVATGALYERFLKIMMLSVSQHTSLPVKFWLLDNFLSPSFKAAALALAEERGFEIAWVNYSWPSWLRGQAELQRRIWGMKVSRGRKGKAARRGRISQVLRRPKQTN